jgi:PadR family transcriptional regulator PadR
MSQMKEKQDVLQGTLALMVLKTLDVLGPLHGYAIARRIEQISGDLLRVNQGTLYPVLLKLEQEGYAASEWGASENNRKARFYRLTRDGRKQLQAESRGWKQTAAIIGRFFVLRAEDLK